MSNYIERATGIVSNIWAYICKSLAVKSITLATFMIAVMVSHAKIDICREDNFDGNAG